MERNEVRNASVKRFAVKMTMERQALRISQGYQSRSQKEIT
jgi:hypothetical protein